MEPQSSSLEIETKCNTQWRKKILYQRIVMTVVITINGGEIIFRYEEDVGYK